MKKTKVSLNGTYGYIDAYIVVGDEVLAIVVFEWKIEKHYLSSLKPA